ncbi:MAG: hypothetical protein AB1898_17500 [Acidobacteriota bacterium]
MSPGNAAEEPTLASIFQNGRLSVYGWAGLFIVGVAEILMIRDVRLVSSFFTPIVWTGYILFADALLAASGKGSFIHRYGPRFLTLCVYSVAFWVVFEYYNLLIQNWLYVNLPERITVRMIGYVWSFATILPGILITSELLELSPAIRHIRGPRLRLTERLLKRWLLLGALLLVVPLLFPSPYLFAPVWLGVVFLLEPINYRSGRPSLLADFEKGRWGRFWALMLGGYVCGLLWEFWNYWAYTKWVYTVPILPEVKIFEMPVLGFLGFGPFAVECYVATNLVFGAKDTPPHPGGVMQAGT